MSRILHLQKLNAIGVERAGAGSPTDMEISTCSYIACSNSTFSCEACCDFTCDIISEA